MALTLVTGATGFIGSHVTHQLLERGEKVRVFVRSPQKLEDVGIDPSSPGLEIETGDLLDPETISPALRDVTHVHHIAGGLSLRDGEARRMREINVTATQNLFDALTGSSVERIVFLASVFALGGGGLCPVDEDSEWSLEHLDVSYVQAKRSAELAVREHAQRGAPVIFAYPGFCYGPGDVYDSSSELVVRFLSGSLPAYVEGGHDAVDVRDAAAGLILAMERGVIGERYLLGGENVTTEQFFGLLTYITGRRAPRIRLTPAVAVGIARFAGHISKEPIMTREMALMSGRYWFYDDRKARTSLGYTSRPLEATLRDAISWLTARDSGRPAR